MELAERYLSELDYDKAIAAYNMALDIDPKSVEAYLGLADAYVGRGEYEEALQVLEKGHRETGSDLTRDKMEELEEYLKSMKESILEPMAEEFSEEVIEEKEKDFSLVEIPLSVFTYDILGKDWLEWKLDELYEYVPTQYGHWDQHGDWVHWEEGNGNGWIKENCEGMTFGYVHKSESEDYIHYLVSSLT